jgi:putative phosphoribosyl transferase
MIDRCDAGQLLAARLGQYAKRADVIVLGIPRGGVVVAAEIARALSVPLDIYITRKIGAPFNAELAIGAVASDGTVFVDRRLAHELHMSDRDITRAADVQKHEIQRRMDLYRRNRPPLIVQNKTVILVDDGIATGATTIAALRALQKQNPQRVILAAPVAPPQVIPLLRAECDEVIVLATPEQFVAVGCFYTDFEQVTDEEVLELLNNSQTNT